MFTSHINSHINFVCSCLLIRISQDLAKDLAMLAREIHDVAGEIDTVSPAATDPGIMVKIHSLFYVCICVLKYQKHSALLYLSVTGKCV